MEIRSFDIPGIKLIIPRRLGDERGYFSETFREDIFQKNCGKFDFVQDNESFSEKAGTVRGLHFQTDPYAQGKLVRCTAGALFDVAVDIRCGSPTYGKAITEVLTPENGKQLWIPTGFAHGFCSIKPSTVICYKVTSYYNAESDKGILWNDPQLEINWPEIADSKTLSNKDSRLPLLSELPKYFTWSE